MARFLPPLVYHPVYSYPFPHGHRFPMGKFALLAAYLRERGLLTHQNQYRPGPCKPGWLESVHCPDYVARFRANRLDATEQRQMGLPWSEALVNRSLRAPSGTVLTAQLALHYGIACHLAGGTHHAHYDHPSGFCIFNDLALAARLLLKSPSVHRVLVFDCDVHQGDGTAALLADEPNAITASIHCEANFPFTKQVSDYDVALPSGMKGPAYIEEVMALLRQVVTTEQPDVVLYDAGVDVFEGDPLGRLAVDEAHIRERDRAVLEWLMTRGLPVATVIGGGYDEDRHALARRHAIVVEEACALAQAGCVTGR